MARLQVLVEVDSYICWDSVFIRCKIYIISHIIYYSMNTCTLGGNFCPFFRFSFLTFLVLVERMILAAPPHLYSFIIPNSSLYSTACPSPQVGGLAKLV